MDDSLSYANLHISQCFDHAFLETERCKFQEHTRLHIDSGYELPFYVLFSLE